MCKLTSTVLRRRPQPPGPPFPARPWASYPVLVDRVGLRPWRTSKNNARCIGVAQHGSSPVAQGRNNQNSSDRGHISSQSSQQYTTAPQDPVAAGNGNGESGATGSGGGKKQQHRSSSSPRSKSKHRDRSSGTSGADEDGGVGGAERRHKSGDRGSRSKNGGSSGRSRGQGQSGQQGQPGQQQRNNSSRKKFAATEVVGPSPKKVGCCRVM